MRLAARFIKSFLALVPTFVNAFLAYLTAGIFGERGWTGVRGGGEGGAVAASPCARAMTCPATPCVEPLVTPRLTTFLSPPFLAAVPSSQPLSRRRQEVRAFRRLDHDRRRAPRRAVDDPRR